MRTHGTVEICYTQRTDKYLWIGFNPIILSGSFIILAIHVLVFSQIYEIYSWVCQNYAQWKVSWLKSQIESHSRQKLWHLCCCTCGIVGIREVCQEVSVKGWVHRQGGARGAHVVVIWIREFVECLTCVMWCGTLLLSLSLSLSVSHSLLCFAFPVQSMLSLPGWSWVKFVSCSLP